MSRGGYLDGTGWRAARDRRDGSYNVWTQGTTFSTRKIGKVYRDGSYWTWSFEGEAMAQQRTLHDAADALFAYWETVQQERAR